MTPENTGATVRRLAPREIGLYIGVLCIAGAGWGLTQPLSKIAVSTGHKHFGLVFWQMLIGAIALTLVSLVRRRGLPVNRHTLRVFVAVALLGTVLPNSASYQAIAYLPSGVVSILLSLVPLMAFPMALGLRLERFAWLRFLGLLVGLVGVLVLILPEASLPDPAMLVWIPVALIAPVFYAAEGNYVARWGTAGLDPIQVLWGASIIGTFLSLPLALGSGQFVDPLRVWSAAEWALVASSLIHAAVYCLYVWLIRQAGPVFAVQVSYIVTGCGVGWAMLILGETYSPYIWAAMALMLLGVLLVQPRRAAA